MGAERASSARDGRAKPQAVKKVSFRESESVLDVSKMEPGCPGERDNDTFVHGKVDKFRNYLIFLFPALGGFLFGETLVNVRLKRIFVHCVINVLRDTYLIRWFSFEVVRIFS